MLNFLKNLNSSSVICLQAIALLFLHYPLKKFQFLPNLLLNFLRHLLLFTVCHMGMHCSWTFCIKYKISDVISEVISWPRQDKTEKKGKKKNKVCWLLNRFSTLQSFTLINKLDREIWADLYLFQYNLTGPLKKKKKREKEMLIHTTWRLQNLSQISES